MARRFVDISVPLEMGVASDPPVSLPRIEYTDHKQSVDDLARFFPGLTADDLPDGEGWANETVHIITHNGTHLDAPYHFASTMNGGERAITIDEVPLEWCYGRGVKLDFRHFADGYVATAADVETELARIGHMLEPFDIVVVNTRAGERYGLGLRDGAGGDALSHFAWRACDGHRCLELGRSLRVHSKAVCGDRGCLDHLGGT
jgi:hypothetical protein